MPNMTLKIDEEVLLGVRKYAALQGTSVNALVRGFLAELAERQDRAKQARKRIRQLSERSEGRVGAARWSRDELHER